MSKKSLDKIQKALQERKRLAKQLPDFTEILRGTLVERYRRCGRPNCHCAKRGDPGHGPAYYLTVTVTAGETVQVYVPKDQKEEVERWIENFRGIRQTLEEISSINRVMLKDGTLFRRK